MTCALFRRQVENSASKHKRRDAICGGSPLFSCPIAFHNPGVFLLSLPRNWRGYSRLSNALSSHRPYGVRRQTFWQRPPFGRPLLVEIFGRVTGLSGPAMQFFLAWPNLVNCAAADAKVPGAPPSRHVSYAFHRLPGCRKNRANPYSLGVKMTAIVNVVGR